MILTFFDIYFLIGLCVSSFLAYLNKQAYPDDTIEFKIYFFIFCVIFWPLVLLQ